MYKLFLFKTNKKDDSILFLIDKALNNSKYYRYIGYSNSHDGQFIYHCLIVGNKSKGNIYE